MTKNHCYTSLLNKLHEVFVCAHAAESCNCTWKKYEAKCTKRIVRQSLLFCSLL